MTENQPGKITRLLQKVGEGDSGAFDRLMPLVYDELREIARRQLREERPGHTLDTRALTHEVYLKLVDEEVDWENRAHFFVLAARAMRQILIDYARKHNAQKRGGEWTRTTLSPRHLRIDVQMGELLALGEVLRRLREVEQMLAAHERADGILDCPVHRPSTDPRPARQLLKFLPAHLCAGVRGRMVQSQRGRLVRHRTILHVIDGPRAYVDDATNVHLARTPNQVLNGPDVHGPGRRQADLLTEHVWKAAQGRD